MTSPFSSRGLKAFCKQKARPPKKKTDVEEEDEEEDDNSFVEEDEEEDDNSLGSFIVSSGEDEVDDKEGDVSSASEPVCTGVSGFLDDEAMEVELSSEGSEVELSSEGSEVGSEVGEESDDGEVGGGGFIMDEAEDEDVYRARKKQKWKRKAVFSSDATDSESLVAEISSRKSDMMKTRKRMIVTSEEEEEDKKELMTVGEESSGEEEDDDGSHDKGEEEDMSCASNSEDEDTTVSSSSKHDSRSSSRNKKAADGCLKWKTDLASKATAAHKHRSTSSSNLRKLIYSDQPLPAHSSQEREEEEEEESEEGAPVIGGLFQLTKKKSLTAFHLEDSSIVSNVSPSGARDWSSLSTSAAVKSLFVTGNWGTESAQALLDEDDALYGDFEDLETGEKVDKAKEEMGDENEEEEEAGKKRMEKKKKLKKSFNMGYDEEGEGGGYLEDLKREVSEQEQRNKAEFEGMDDRMRLQLEGIQPGHYVRMELKGKRGHEEMYLLLLSYL